MSNNTRSISILGTIGWATTTDANEISIYVNDEAPAIVAGIAYSFRTYLVRNPETGNWRSKSSFFIDRLIMFLANWSWTCKKSPSSTTMEMTSSIS